MDLFAIASYFYQSFAHLQLKCEWISGELNQWHCVPPLKGLSKAFGHVTSFDLIQLYGKFGYEI